MEIIFEFIFSFLIELFGQVLFELLAESGLRSISNALGMSKPKKKYLSLLGYILLASVGALVSIFFFKEHFIKNESLRIINLFITPIILGMIMKFRGKKLEGNDLESIRLDSFWYGYVFALTFALIRYFYSH